LTNLRTSDLDLSRESRGSIVMDALARGSARAATRHLASLPAGHYNGFNCLVADRETASVITYRDRPVVHSLSPGVHVIGNADAAAAMTGHEIDDENADGRLNDDRQLKVDRVRARAGAAAALPADEVLDALAGICREHGSGQSPLDDTCVHVSGTHMGTQSEVFGGRVYGTRSSILLELSDDAGSSRLLHSTGAPCTTSYHEVSSLLDELRRSPGYGSAEFSTRTAT
jgi:uncharacterized protein with NRDE domain